MARFDDEQIHVNVAVAITAILRPMSQEHFRAVCPVRVAQNPNELPRSGPFCHNRVSD
jgi:hypothetical protein